MGETLGHCIGLSDEVIYPAVSLAIKAHHNSRKPFLVEERGSSVVVFAFSGSFPPDDGLGLGQPPFGVRPIDTDMFPSMRSLNDGGDAAVNASFLRRFSALLDPSYKLSQKVKKVTEKKQVVFAGYSSAGPMAILATLYFLEKDQIKPRCLTFGSPLVGDRIFGHALRREGWSEYFAHFVMKYDIVPRLMLAPFSSEHREILNYLKSKHDGKRQHMIMPPSGFYHTVMGSASSVASYDACNLMRCRNQGLDTLRSFVELSPYRPFGTYVFCNGNGNLVVVRNQDAILQMLIHCAKLDESDDAAQIERKSLDEHLGYADELRESLEMQAVVYLDGASPATTMAAALNDLGLNSQQAVLCVQAAEESGKRRSRNLVQIQGYTNKIRSSLDDVKRYKENSEIRGLGYYDSFKLQNEEDFKANVTRLELAGMYDEIKEMLKDFELPDVFERTPEVVDLGTAYRRLVEPLDIANFYRHSKDKESGSYVTGRGARPKRYRFAQRWLEHKERKPKWESCMWAEVEQLRIDIKEKGYLPEIRERIHQVERNLIEWIGDESLDGDVLLENSTFVKWWRDQLPPHHRSQSDAIKELIRQKAAGTLRVIASH